MENSTLTAQLKKAALVLVAALALTGMFSKPAYATHFRYSHHLVVGESDQPHQVTFQIQSAWRWDFPWSPTTIRRWEQTSTGGYVFNFGDGTAVSTDPDRHGRRLCQATGWWRRRR